VFEHGMEIKTRFGKISKSLCLPVS
jgi:hypothetical protein